MRSSLFQAALLTTLIATGTVYATTPAPTSAGTLDTCPVVHKLSDYVLNGYDFSLYSALDPAVSGTTSVDGAVRQAWEYYRSGQSASATMALSTYLEKMPDDVTARYLLSEIRAADGNTDGAIKDLETALSKNPQFLPAALRLSALYLQTNNVKAAQALVEKSRAQWPKQPDLALDQGQIAEAQNNLDAARQSYLNALQLDPYNPEAHYKMAQLDIKQNQWDAAAAELKSMLAFSPDSTRAIKLLGDVYQHQNKPDDAAQCYAKLLDPAALVGYAQNLQKANKTADALAVLKTAETLNTNGQPNPGAFYDIGMLYADLQEKTDAQRLLQKFIDTASKSDSRVTTAEARLKTLNAAPTTAAPETSKTVVPASDAKPAAKPAAKL